MDNHKLALKVFRLQNNDYALSNKLIEDVYSQLNTVGVFEYYPRYGTATNLSGIFREVYTDRLADMIPRSSSIFNTSTNSISYNTPVRLGFEHGFTYIEE